MNPASASFGRTLATYRSCSSFSVSTMYGISSVCAIRSAPIISSKRILSCTACWSMKYSAFPRSAMMNVSIARPMYLTFLSPPASFSPKREGSPRLLFAVSNEKNRVRMSAPPRPGMALFGSAFSERFRSGAAVLF